MERSVLVVDDDPTIRKICRILLEREGYSVLEADDGLQGLKLCQSVRIDAVLTDLNMPRMNGLEFAERVGKLGLGIRFMFMSGCLPEGTTEIPDGPFMIKPFTQRNLISSVRSLMPNETPTSIDKNEVRKETDAGTSERDEGGRRRKNA